MNPTDQPTPTPETDAQNMGWWNHPSLPSCSVVPIDFARRLERERDAAIADREKLREQVERLEGDVQLLTAAKTDANIARKKAIAERDALAAKICEQQP